MGLLIPIRYNHRSYPDGIQPSIREVPGHLDVVSIGKVNNYSLHTEYSARDRKLNSPLLQRLQTIRMANIDGLPQLWRNSHWAEEFVEFIQAIVGENEPPLLIEIHPPFRDYCPSLEEFCSVYRVFEERISAIYPKTEILIENRFGTTYKKGKFLISSYQDVVYLVSQLHASGLRLQIVLDVPQLISQMGDVSRISSSQLEAMFAALKPCRTGIRSIHLWGKRRNDKGRWCAHAGNLDTYFEGNHGMKENFLAGLYDLLNDGQARYFVPEVNSNQDVASIVGDLLSVGFKFQNSM